MMLKKLYRRGGIALRMMQRAVDREILVRRDIRRQLRGMEAGVPVAIRTTRRLREGTSGVEAFLVLYRPGGEVPSDIVRLCAALDARGVATWLIANHPLSPAQDAALAGHVAGIVERDNQGGDFGAWREVTLGRLAQGALPERILYLNDSVFFGSRGLDAFLDRLIAGSAATFAFENWAEDYHLQSFAFALDGAVLAHPAVGAFWSGYRPINNRIHAIETGEKGLSAAIHEAARGIEVIYTVEGLSRALESEDAFDLDLITVPKSWRRDTDLVTGRVEATRFGRIRTVTDVVAATSPIHAGAYFFPRYLDCPLYKKDLVIRERFDFWEIAHWTEGLLPPDERADYLRELRARGEPRMLPSMQRRRIAVGL